MQQEDCGVPPAQAGCEAPPFPGRDMVMGKQAYLYCRNYESVDRACIMYSLFGACKVLGKNPERWLTYVLKHIDTTPKEDLHKLLPEEWEDA